MSNQVATKPAEVELAPAQNEGGALISMIERVAMNPNTGIDTLERLLQMQERVMDREARSAYSRDFAAMQADMPTIEERGKGHNNITYALWEDVNKAIRPVLTMYGFGLSFRTGHTEKQITITAILSHREGHSEETTQSFPHDTSGSKNAIQAVGSSMQYGKRYTAGALLNLTSGETDNDGAGDKDLITDEQAMNLRELLESKGRDEKEFCKYIEVAGLADIWAENYDKCVALVNRAKTRSA